MEPAARLAQLDPGINQIARRYHGAHNLDQAEIKQHIALKFLERCQVDPAFTNRTDPQLIKFADWRAKNLIESTVIYSNYVDSEVFVPDEDGEEESSFEWIADGAPLPETTAILHETAVIIDRVIGALGERRQTICRMLASGYTEAEIARHLGVSRGAISQQKTVIRQALEQAILD